ncbi:MAG: hypothetical protein ACMUIU_17805 [bacterium]
MKNENFDDLIRQVLSLIEDERKKGYKEEEEGSECISAKTICDLLGSRLSDTERNRVEHHLSLCLFCRKLVNTVFELEKPGEKEITDKIKEKISAFAESLKISLAWVQGHLKLIETDADYLPCWDALKPVLLRDDTEKEIPSLPRFHKSFNEYKVYVQVIEEDKGNCEIQCQILPLSEKYGLSGITVDLLQGERILFSCPVQEDKDTIIFHAVRTGEYKIRIRKADRQIALLSMNIKKESE